MPRYTEIPAAELAFAHSPEGIGRAELLAASTFEHFINSVDLAKLDTTIASTFLVAELLAALKVYAGVEPEALIEQFRGMIDQNTAEMRRDCAGPFGAGPAAVPSAVAVH